MENAKKNEKQGKTQVFNLIILDKSGSMDYIRQAAVSGFNETLEGIRKAQEKYEDSQEHNVSLVTFCSCETKYVYDRVPVSDARPLSMADYRPCCNTPLYDAMGFTLSSMRKHVEAVDDAVVVVTIITDGLENASREYTQSAIKQLVEVLKGEGWTFTYMGANQNSEEVAFNLSIRNSRNFDFSEEGTVACMTKDADTRLNFYERLHDFHADPKFASMRKEDRDVCYREMADRAFDEEESKGREETTQEKRSRLSAILGKLFS